ncbi:MAG: hypothetical protein R3B70_21870 [Polyangiaceae bacterium]
MLGRKHPSDIQDAQLVAILGKHLPPIISRSIVERARREAISGNEVSWTDPNGLLDRISVGVRLFAAPEQQAAILREITDLAVRELADAAPPSQRLGLDPDPSSSMKPASTRARGDEPITRREQALHHIPPPAPSSAGKADLGASAPRDELAGSSRRDGELPPTISRRDPDSPAASRRDPDASPSAREARESREAREARAASPEPSSSPRAEASAASRAETPIPARREPATPAPAPLPPRRPTDVPASTAARGVFPSGGSRSTFGSSSRTSPTRATAPSPGTRPTPYARAGGTPPAGVPRVSGATPQVPRYPHRTGSTTRPRVEVIGAVPKAPLAPSRAEIFGRVPQPSRDNSLREMTIQLTSEHDIPLARQVAREICEHLGTRALTQQRLLTIVSELGRNMVLYAGGGRMTLRPPTAKSRRIVVVAVDQGGGIPNLQEIMAGKYKSRSGLGLGLLGTKRLADSFHIETGRSGTTVVVEVIL